MISNLDAAKALWNVCDTKARYHWTKNILAGQAGGFTQAELDAFIDYITA